MGHLFPSLTDADGWQVPSRRGFELDVDANDKTDWRDRTRDAAEKPAPASAPRIPVVARKKKKEKVFHNEGVEPLLGLDDYELRQQQGRRRALNHSQFGLSVGSCEKGLASQPISEA